MVTHPTNQSLDELASFREPSMTSFLSPLKAHTANANIEKFRGGAMGALSNYELSNGRTCNRGQVKTRWLRAAREMKEAPTGD
jgi:hypothetical protein